MPVLRSRRPAPRRALVALAALATLVAGACHGPDERAGRPLLRPDRAVVTLVESREIAPPPAPGGTRFAGGWHPDRGTAGEPGFALRADEERGGSLDVVSVASRPRDLVLDVGPEAGEVRVVGEGGLDLRVRGGPGALRVALPPLGPGTSRLTLRTTLPVRAAALPAALAAGSVEEVGGEHGDAPGLRTRGAVVGEVVLHLARPELLLGRIEVVERGSFALELASGPGRGSDVVRRDGGLFAGLRGRGSFAVALPAGWSALRFRSETPDGEALWRNLRLAEVPGTVVATDAEGRPVAAGSAEVSGAGSAAAAAAASTTPPGAAAAVATLAEAGAKTPRLVVLVVFDALRADHVGHLGGSAGITPEIDRLATAGWTFTAHRAVAPNTLPSTKALLTGRVWRDRGGWKLAPEDGPTLAERFAAAGWKTALVSGNLYVGPEYGTDRGFGWVAPDTFFDRYDPVEHPRFNDNAARVANAALAWIRSLGPGERAFLYLHVVAPHNPYAPPEPFRGRFLPANASTIDGTSETLLAVRNRRRPVDDADRARLAGLYSGAVAYGDAELARFLAALASVVPPEDTALAVTADHGEELFDHGGVLHGYTVYEEMLRIPLVLWAPGRLAPRRVAEPTTTVDLHATLLDLAGLPPDAGCEGSSLLRPLPYRPVLYAAGSSVKGGIFAAVGEGWKLVLAPRAGGQWGQGEGIGRSREPEYAFDLGADPHEGTNRAAESPLPARWLAAALARWRSSGMGIDVGGGEEPVLDEAARARLRSLGYLN